MVKVSNQHNRAVFSKSKDNGLLLLFVHLLLQLPPFLADRSSSDSRPISSHPNFPCPHHSIVGRMDMSGTSNVSGHPSNAAVNRPWIHSMHSTIYPCGLTSDP